MFLASRVSSIRFTEFCRMPMRALMSASDSFTDELTQQSTVALVSKEEEDLRHICVLVGLS